jgi:beta-lactamase regulating signal transducer with metallopeptidase domain
MELISAYLAWLLQASWQTAVLVALLLGAQRGFRRWLTPRWRHALWLLVIARALLPVAPASDWSVFNVAGARQAARWPEAALAAVSKLNPTPASTAIRPQVPATLEKPGRSPAQTQTHAIGELPKPTTLTVTPRRGASAPATPSVLRRAWQSLAPQAWLFGGWLAGFLWVSARILLPQVRLRARLRHAERVADPDTLSRLRDARRAMGLRQAPRLLRTEAIRVPALHGFWRPCLLLPADASLDAAELRFIFLHELAHLRRRDMAVLWLMTLVKTLHWFNPLIWLAANRLGAACELACDHEVLTRLEAREKISYGRTIIKQLERLTPSGALPGLASLGGEKRWLYERMAAIRDHKLAAQFSLAGLALAVAAAVFCLTDPVRQFPAPVAPPPPPVVTVTLSHSNAPAKVFFAQGPGLAKRGKELQFFFILPDGSLWQWGRDWTNRQLPARPPQPLDTNQVWAKVQMAGEHGVALRRDGTLWEWGRRLNGAAAATPVSLNLGSGWKDIAAGKGLLVALKHDGTLWGMADPTAFPAARAKLPEGLHPIGTHAGWETLGGGLESYGPVLGSEGSLWVWDLVSWTANSEWTGHFPEPSRVGTRTGWRLVDSYEMALAIDDRGTLLHVSGIPEFPGKVMGFMGLHQTLAPNCLAIVLDRNTREDYCYAINNGALVRGSYPEPRRFDQIGSRTDWTALWGLGSVVGLTADGTLWTWGEDLNAVLPKPPTPPFSQRAFQRFERALGIQDELEPPPVQLPIFTEPRPLLKWELATAPTTLTAPPTVGRPELPSQTFKLTLPDCEPGIGAVTGMSIAELALDTTGRAQLAWRRFFSAAAGVNFQLQSLDNAPLNTTHRSLTFDPKACALTARAPANELAIVARLVRSLDRRAPIIRLTAKLVETISENNQSFSDADLKLLATLPPFTGEANAAVLNAAQSALLQRISPNGKTRPLASLNWQCVGTRRMQLAMLAPDSADDSPYVLRALPVSRSDNRVAIPELEIRLTAGDGTAATNAAFIHVAGNFELDEGQVLVALHRPGLLLGAYSYQPLTNYALFVTAENVAPDEVQPIPPPEPPEPPATNAPAPRSAAALEPLKKPLIHWKIRLLDSGDRGIDGPSSNTRQYIFFPFGSPTNGVMLDTFGASSAQKPTLVWPPTPAAAALAPTVWFQFVLRDPQTSDALRLFDPATGQRTLFQSTLQTPGGQPAATGNADWRLNVTGTLTNENDAIKLYVDLSYPETTNAPPEASPQQRARFSTSVSVWDGQTVVLSAATQPSSRLAKNQLHLLIQPTIVNSAGRRARSALTARQLVTVPPQ